MIWGPAGFRDRGFRAFGLRELELFGTLKPLKP